MIDKLNGYSPHRKNRRPFQERKSPLRAALDIVSCSYPSFVFGGGLGRILPVFHFHDVTTDYLEPFFIFLTENGYKTVMSGALSAVARGEVEIEPRTVALCFDDAWASMWTVVLPLLKKYDLQAITYVISGRVEAASDCRSLYEDEPSGPAFATWAELEALHHSGHVDIQAHTHTHAMMFCSSEITDFISPSTELPLLSLPLSAESSTDYISKELPGYPLFLTRSRMSDAYRFIPDNDVIERSLQKCSELGGPEMFTMPTWRDDLLDAVGTVTGRYETDSERDEAICRELNEVKGILEARLSKKISQICMPWAVCGKRTEDLAVESGYDSVVADTLFGKRYVHKGANPRRLMRLKHEYIMLLPGKGRRYLMNLNKEDQ